MFSPAPEGRQFIAIDPPRHWASNVCIHEEEQGMKFRRYRLGFVGLVALVTACTLPVPVVDVDNPTREPVSLGARLSVSDGGDNSSGDPNSVFFIVPTDRRLVIEFVNFFAINTLFDEIYQGEITTTVGGRTVRWFFGPLAAGCKAGRCGQTFSQAVRIYADPDTEVKAFVVRESRREGDVVDVNISGYLNAF